MWPWARGQHLPPQPPLPALSQWQPQQWQRPSVPDQTKLLVMWCWGDGKGTDSKLNQCQGLKGCSDDQTMPHLHDCNIIRLVQRATRDCNKRTPGPTYAANHWPEPCTSQLENDWPVDATQHRLQPTCTRQHRVGHIKMMQHISEDNTNPSNIASNWTCCHIHA